MSTRSSYNDHCAFETNRNSFPGHDTISRLRSILNTNKMHNSTQIRRDKTCFAATWPFDDDFFFFVDRKISSSRIAWNAAGICARQADENNERGKKSDDDYCYHRARRVVLIIDCQYYARSDVTSVYAFDATRLWYACEMLYSHTKRHISAAGLFGFVREKWLQYSWRAYARKRYDNNNDNIDHR